MSEFQPFNADEGLILAVRLPGTREELHERRRGWAELSDGTRERPLWIHLDQSKERARAWVRGASGLDPIVADALLAEETRPRFQAVGEGLLVILRGVNMNPGAEPDELIAIQMWLEPTRIVTLRAVRFQTTAELRRLGEEGRLPETVGGFLAAVAGGLARRLSPSVTNLEDMLDEVEDEMIDEDVDEPAHRKSLSTIRRQAIIYRRHLVPQRDALNSLALEPTKLLGDREKAELRAVGEQIARIAEDLEALRDRAAVAQEELRARREARTSRTVYLLTIIATVALPLSLLTGLLGINVGGIPMAENAGGFVAVCVGLVVLAVAEVLVFKWLKLL